MTDSSDLNPYFAEVIGFVSPNGDLLEGPSEKQFDLLINAGSDAQLRTGSRVLVFALGQEITDPRTLEMLGRFEIVRGEGRVKSVQPRMAVVTSEETRDEIRAKKPTAFAMYSGGGVESERVTLDAPFRRPQVGDLVRLI